MREFVKVETGGSGREIGVDIGRATAGILRELVAGNPVFYRSETGRGLDFIKRYVFRNFLPFVRRRYPSYLAEIRGIAEGAGLDFADIAVFSAEEELLDTWGGWDKCSTAAVRLRGRLLLLHSEDYIGRYHDKMVLVRAEPSGRPAFLSLSYPGTLAGSACGINSAGIATCNNSLRYQPRRRGIPKNFYLRDTLAARSVDDVIRSMAIGPRAVAGNVTVASSREGRAAFVEATLTQTAVANLGRNYALTHTNNVRSPEIDVRDERPTRNSLLRLAELDYMLRRRHGSYTLSYLGSVLGSEAHHLLRFNTKEKAAATLASVIMDPGRRTMHIAVRSRRGNPYVRYRL